MNELGRNNTKSRMKKTKKILSERVNIVGNQTAKDPNDPVLFTEIISRCPRIQRHQKSSLCVNHIRRAA